jgi:hypothetical protein
MAAEGVFCCPAAEFGVGTGAKRKPVVQRNPTAACAFQFVDWTQRLPISVTSLGMDRMCMQRLQPGDLIPSSGIGLFQA